MGYISTQVLGPWEAHVSFQFLPVLYFLPAEISFSKIVHSKKSNSTFFKNYINLFTIFPVLIFNESIRLLREVWFVF